MTSKIVYNIKKPQFGKKNLKWGLPLIVTAHKLVRNKKLPTKHIVKTIDSSIKNPGKVEYNK